MTKPNIEKVCEICSSDRVHVDAYAEWNIDTQAWELASLFDHSWCYDCDTETDIIDKPADQMTEQQYEMHASAIATAIWEITTGNGRDLDEYLGLSHSKNCQTAVNNTYTDNITVERWQALALAWLRPNADIA